MKVLLDECLPKKLKHEFPGHDTIMVQEMGWAGVKNGDLLRMIHGTDIEVFVTIDSNLEYQQNLNILNFGVIVLNAPDNAIDSLRPLVPQILAALKTIKAGKIVHVTS